MGTKLSELEIGTPVSLRISAKNKSMRLDAVIQNHISEKLAVIELLFDSEKRLKFDNVKTDMEFYPDGNVPVIWHNVKISSYQTAYSVQVFAEGTRHNRRDTFRVGISSLAILSTSIPDCPHQVIIRDLSLTGFSITEKKNLPLDYGDTISVFWSDLDHELNLTGQLIRIEEREQYTIYGFEIRNICKDLASYINVKQIQRRK